MTMADNASSLKLFDNAKKEKLVKLWLKFFSKSVKCDKWGQVVEAVDGYQELEGVLTNRLEENKNYVTSSRRSNDGHSNMTNSSCFTDDEIYGLDKIIQSIKVRERVLIDLRE